MLIAAGCLVSVTAFAGHLMSTSLLTKPGQTWGSGLYVLLGLLVAAMVLAASAVSGGRSISISPAATFGSPRIRSGVWLGFAALALIHVSSVMIWRPGSGALIDTYTFQRDAVGNLLHGVDPYGGTQANLYTEKRTSQLFGQGMVIDGRVQVGFQYPPLTLLWIVPGYLLGDVRLSYVLAVIVSAFFLLGLRPDKRGLALVSILLLSPLTFVVEYLCWTEPLVLMTLSATVYAAVKKRWWLPIALGLFLATKQYNFLALPLIAYFVRPFAWKAYLKLTGIAIAVGAATVLPFAVWNLHGLWHDLVLFHLAQPFRQDAVSFAVLFPWMIEVGPVLVLAFMVWALRAGRGNATLFPAAYGVALLLFVCTNKQAFANYYFLIAQTFFLAAVAVIGAPDTDRPGAAG